MEEQHHRGPPRIRVAPEVEEVAVELHEPSIGIARIVKRRASRPPLPNSREIVRLMNDSDHVGENLSHGADISSESGPCSPSAYQNHRTARHLVGYPSIEDVLHLKQ